MLQILGLFRRKWPPLRRSAVVIRRTPLMVLLAGSILGTGTALAQDAVEPLPSVALPPEFDRVLRDYERAWEAGDADALAGLFTEDGFVPTGAGWVRGREAIRETYARAGGALRLRALAYAVQDTVGYIVGAYRYADDPATPTADRGKFVLALRRSPGGPWRIAADLDNTNRP